MVSIVYWLDCRHMSTLTQREDVEKGYLQKYLRVNRFQTSPPETFCTALKTCIRPTPRQLTVKGSVSL